MRSTRCLLNNVFWPPPKFFVLFHYSRSKKDTLCTFLLLATLNGHQITHPLAQPRSTFLQTWFSITEAIHAVLMENDAIEIANQGYFECFFRQFRNRPRGNRRDCVHDIVYISHSQVAERYMWGPQGLVQFWWPCIAYFDVFNTVDHCVFFIDSEYCSIDSLDWTKSFKFLISIDSEYCSNKK